MILIYYYLFGVIIFTSNGIAFIGMWNIAKDGFALKLLIGITF